MLTPVGSNHKKLRAGQASSGVMLPFVKPRLPSLDKLKPYFNLSEKAGYYANGGPLLAELEKRIQSLWMPDQSVLACSSATAGLTAAITSISRSGSILIPGFTFPATASAVYASGLSCELGDVDVETGILNPDTILAAPADCSAVIIVIPYGYCFDLSEQAEACRKRGLPLIVDAAAALGVSAAVLKKSLPKGSIGVFSLHATKPFGIGEGGIICAPQSQEAALRSALNFGFGRDETGSGRYGANGKLDELRAAMALAVLDTLIPRINRRQHVAQFFLDAAREMGLRTFGDQAEECAWQCFPVRLPDPDLATSIIEGCFARGLQARRYYHPVIGEAKLPVSQDLASRTVCLPIYDAETTALTEAKQVWNIFIETLKEEADKTS